jgi:hypothetical protein
MGRPSGSGAAGARRRRVQPLDTGGLAASVPLAPVLEVGPLPALGSPVGAGDVPLGPRRAPESLRPLSARRLAGSLGPESDLFPARPGSESEFFSASPGARNRNFFPTYFDGFSRDVCKKWV